MADNTTINSGSGGDTISTDDVGGGVKVQRVKIQFGIDGSATDVSSSNALPVSDNGTTLSVDDGAASLTVDGTITAVGADAHDAAASGTPVRIAGRYVSSPPKVSATGDVAELVVTQEGKILTPPWTVAADTSYTNTSYGSAQTNAALVSAPGANKRLVVTEIVYSKDTAGSMKLVEDTAGTPAAKFGPHYFPANGGLTIAQCYIPLTANKNLGITTTGGGNETISVRTIVENV